jgi:tRNA(His) 5'-end guanylyltransferase
MKSLGDRIKEYENASTHKLLKKTPVLIRVDGKAFHTYCRNFDKPFDKILMKAMNTAAFYVATEIQGFKVAYIQSDEVTFALTDYDNIETDAWFNYKISKIVSISASIMTARFNRIIQEEKPNVPLAYFDSRAFNVPKEDVVNAFLWRAHDWERNSLQMYARKFFSHKQLMNKNKQDIHEMLHGIRKNWNKDLTPQEKNGTFLIKKDNDYISRYDIKPNFMDLQLNFGELFL